MKKLDSNNNSTATQTATTARSSSTARQCTARSTSSTAARTATTVRRSSTATRSTTTRRSATTRRASASKKGSGYNKYVPVFIDNYVEQRSAKLRAKMGWQAYGIYLAILQRLRSEKDCTLELDYESLALSFWTDEDNLRAIIEDFNLFTINRHEGTFYSPLLDSMLSTLDPSLAQSRAPLSPEPVEEDVCEMTEEENDFSDENSSVLEENSSVLEENIDVTEKEFRVKEKEFDAPNTQNDAQNDAEFNAEFDAEFDAKNSVKSDAKRVLQMCTNVLQNDALQSDANEHFSTVAHVRVNKQTNKQTNHLWW